jgi:S-formylglutathione hydrolase
MDELQTVAKHRLFGGTLGIYRHSSRTTATPMTFSVFVPPRVPSSGAPTLTFLAGLTCTWENFTTKSGAYRAAAEAGFIVVAPDTSPRDVEIPGDRTSWDFGVGAGFYVDATLAPWNAHYRMFSYVTDELPRVVEGSFPTDGRRRAIMGHSMGGHGALVCALRRPDVYGSVSAFAPIAAPTQCPWGEKAFTGYLGPDRETWNDYDATQLVLRKAPRTPLLIDQGGADKFKDDQLKPQLLERACRETNTPLELRIHDGYDHSYFFIATFVADHVAFHANNLRA